MLMAWGYERGFVIEHDNTVKRRIDCKDCVYYERDDKSCMKRPLYLPVDGYNSWRNCSFFELDPWTNHYEEKKVQYMNTLKRLQAQKNKNQKLPQQKTKTISKKSQITSHNTATPKSRTEQKKISIPNRSGYTIIAHDNKKLKKGLRHDYVTIVTDRGLVKKILVSFDDEHQIAFINRGIYTREAIEKVKAVLG